MPFYLPVHTGPLAELVSYFFAAALVPTSVGFSVQRPAARLCSEIPARTVRAAFQK
jgi:hypothetical protein